MSRIINGIIFLITLVIVLSLCRNEGRWSAAGARNALRYFTVQSNILCALSALLLCLFPEARWAWTLKYIGTQAVTVTMLTVFFFLGPTLDCGLRGLLRGRDFFLHLATPLLALLSFLLFERRGMGLGTALPGLLPVALYGALYLYRVILAPADRRWEDFYGFNRGGKWPLSMGAMLLGSFLVCLGLMALQNL